VSERPALTSPWRSDPDRHLDPVGLADLPLRVFLRRRSQLLSVVVLVLATALAVAGTAQVSSVFASIIGAVDVLLCMFAAVPALDPRPQVVIEREGITFGGLMKSAAGRDRSYRWSEIEAVGGIESQARSLRFGRLPFLPGRLQRQTESIAGSAFSVQTSDGKRYLVRSPRGGMDLHRVRAVVRETMNGSP
jgi:hypothetical protein